MNRRELLQMFGIGTVIAPVLGGTAVTTAAAKLIEVPKVEPVGELFDGFFPSNPITGRTIRVQDSIPVWLEGRQHMCPVKSLTRGQNYPLIETTSLLTAPTSYRTYSPGEAYETLAITVLLPRKL